MPSFVAFGLTRPGIKPESTVSLADASSTRPLISKFFFADRQYAIAINFCYLITSR